MRPRRPRAHLRASTPAWPELTRRAAGSGSVHTIKLIEALVRFRAVDDALCRSVAAQWLERPTEGSAAHLLLLRSAPATRRDGEW